MDHAIRHNDYVVKRGILNERSDTKARRGKLKEKSVHKMMEKTES